MKQIKITSLLLFILPIIVFLSSCQTLSPETLAATKEAVNRLQKLKAATDIGVKKSEYGELLIDARTAVNQALPKIKDGELKNELQTAMECYADAKTLWDGKDSEGLMFVGSFSTGDKDDKLINMFNETMFSETVNKLTNKYNIPTHTSEFSEMKLLNNVPFILKEEGVAVIWKKADEHTQRVEALIK